MINIIEKKDCCGCSACVSICPKHCITMSLDNEGFLYPQVDNESCIDCGLCEKVCLVLNQGKECKPFQVYAAKKINEEIRMKSSSGGIFTLLAEQILHEGGVVFGARFNADWEVIHDYTETKEGLAAFRGSKYVQSRLGDSFCQAEHFLRQGRKVMFTGTPCQIAGLKLFLRKTYDNLLTVDFICHGVPSPGVWKKYLEELIALKDNRKNSVLSHSKLIILNSIRDISRIEFRNKCLGWKKYSFALTLSVPNGHGTKNTVLLSEPYNKNIFMKGFLADLYLRPSCYACPSKSMKSGSDITLGDFWGIQYVMPERDDDKGICCLMVNTEKGCQFLPSDKWVEYSDSDYSTVIKYNKACVMSVVPNLKRNLFFDKFQKTDSVVRLIDKILTPPFFRRFLSFAKRLVNKIFHLHSKEISK